MSNKKNIKLTEAQFFDAVSKMVLEYIGDNGMLGRQDLDDIEDQTTDFNTQPSNDIIGDESDHDEMGVGESNIDPSFYEDMEDGDDMSYLIDPDEFKGDNHELSDNELYNYGNW